MAKICLAQYPYCHSITSEEGLPSNEVYSIIQDKKGFVWIGCNAGLVRYNGVSFKQYRNASQRSRIIAGLTISNSGRIYGYNFSNQVFYLENDSLHELQGLQAGVTNIATSADGRFWVSGADGVFVYNEPLDSWQQRDTAWATSTRGICVDEQEAVWFLNLTTMRVCRMAYGKTEAYEVKHTKGDNFNLAIYLLSVGKLGEWLVPITGGEVCKFDGKAFVPVVSQSLNETLKGRKSNHILQMPDGRLWFCTYSGIVVYNPAIDSTEVLYDGISFSDVMKSREGGVWLTSLHKGLFYISDMRFLNWGETFEALPSNSITQLDIQNNNLYYATSDGYFGQMDLGSKKIQSHYLGVRGDINGLFFDIATNTLLLNSSIDIYGFTNGKLAVQSTKSPPVKSIVRAGNQLYYATSFGLYVSNGSLGDEGTQKLSNMWCRDVLYTAETDKIWVASDTGVQVISATDRTLERTIVPNVQVVALAAHKEDIFALLFSGEIIAIGKDHNVKPIAQLPNDANGADMEVVEEGIWVATNQGVMIYDQEKHQWMVIDKILGLASNSVKVIKQNKNHMWLATGNGIQAIPVDYNIGKPAAKAYLTSLTVNGELHDVNIPLQLAYKDVLAFVPEAVAYSSMGKFQYAYRTLQGDTAWQMLPANT